MNTENVLPHEMDQTQEDKCSMIPPIGGTWNSLTPGTV